MNRDGDPEFFSHDGPALLLEAGIGGLRDWQFGRLSLYLQLVEPLFHVPVNDEYLLPAGRVPLLIGGVRAML